MRIFIGLILLALGVLFLLSNAGLVEFDFNLGTLIATYWPSLIIIWGLREILVGLSRLFSSTRRTRGHLFYGLVLLAVGVILQGNKLDLFQIGWDDVWKYFWPILIIYIGFSILFNRSSSGFSATISGNRNKDNLKQEYVDGDYINRSHENWKSADKPKKIHHPIRKKMFLGDLHLGRSSWDLEDLSIWMGVGDVDVDLTRALIPDGETVVDISGLVGDLTVRIPEDLAVKVEAEVRLGDVHVLGHRQAGTGRLVTYKSEQYDFATKKVYILASLMIGEVSVKRVH